MVSVKKEYLDELVKKAKRTDQLENKFAGLRDTISEIVKELIENGEIDIPTEDKVRDWAREEAENITDDLTVSR